MKPINIKKYFIILNIVLLIVIFCSSFSYASVGPQNIRENKQNPISVAAKYDNSIYINKIENHNYLVNGNKRIPIPIKYYYSIKNILVFLGEDDTLYYSNEATTEIKVLLKDSKAAVSTGKNGDYVYALNKKGELFKITVDTVKIEMIKTKVTSLYSAWKDWVIYQTSENKWWKHYIDKEAIQVEHKSGEVSPFIPNTEIGSPIQDRHIVVGPWCITEVEHHDLVGWHGGQNLYNDYSTYLWEYIDGISGSHEFYNVDQYGERSYEILGVDENNLYISLKALVSEINSHKRFLKIYHIKSSEKENYNTEDFGPGKINYYKCIYTDQIGPDEKIPQFYWTSNGIYKFSIDGKNIDLISLNGDLPTSVYRSESKLLFIKMLSDKLYFKEILNNNEELWVIDLKDNSVKNVDSVPDDMRDQQWKISVVKQSILYKNENKTKVDKEIASFEDKGIWIYSKGLVNAVYTSGDSIILLRNGKKSIIKDNIKSLDWEKAFSMDGWIYLYIDGYLSRFQPDNPKNIQPINIKIEAPVFKAQDNQKNVIVTDSGYIYYNTKTRGIESVSKAGKNLKVITGKMFAAEKFWYKFGYVYFINAKDNSLYRVLPNGTKAQKVINDFIDAAFFKNKIYCITHIGIFSISSTGVNKQLIINKNFKSLNWIDNQSYIDHIESSGDRVIIFLIESVPDPDSDFNFLYKKYVYSMTTNFKNSILLPSASFYNIIDSYYYYIDIYGKVCRISLDGEGNQVLH